MNKKYILAALCIFVVWMGGSFLVHEVLLGSGYESVSQLYRTDADMQSKTHFMLLGHLIMAFAFVWLYTRGISKSPWLGQGFRFGLGIVFLAVVPMYMIYYVIMPLPESLVLKQMLFEGLLTLILALILAFIYRSEAT